LAVNIVAVASTLAIYVIIGLVVYALWRRRRRSNEPDDLLPTGDATRYALASAVLEGASFRRRVIDLARHRFRAKAPELGLDFPLVLAACRRFEREDRIFDWLVVGATLLCAPLVLAILNPQLAYSLFGYAAIGYGGWGVLAVVVILLVKAIRDVTRITPFHRAEYDAADVRRQFLDDDAPAPGNASENVICYGGRQPFVGLGVHVGGWQVAVEMDREAAPALAPLRTNGQSAVPVNITTGELLRAVDDSVQVLNIPNLEMRFPLFVSGVDLGASRTDRQGLETVLPDKFASPRTQTDNATLARFWFQSDPRARSYRWYMITDWNGELVFSYMLRIVQRGRSMSIETARLVLPPIDVKYRKIDFLSGNRVLAWLAAIVGAVLRSPFSILYSALGAMQHLLELLRLADRGDAGERRQILRNPAYNYGARTSLRETMSARNYHVYFQRIDAQQYFTAIDRRVLNSLTETLQRAGIDVSSLIGQAQLIVNNSTNVIDNSGTIAFGNVGAGAAVGANATGVAGLATQAATVLGNRVSK
jgi:hypothetical protein